MSSKKPPSFQFYPKDFISDGNVVVMDNDEVGMYIFLLSHCWIEGSLPEDEDDLAKIARSTPKKFKKSWEKRIKKCFTENKKGEIVHPRLEEERQKQKDYKEKKAAAGRKGARSRWQDNESDNDKDMEVPEEENGSAIDLPLAKNGSSSSSSSAIANIPPPPPVRARLNDSEVPDHMVPVAADPPDEDEVIEFFLKNGAEERQAKEFYNHYHGQGWKKRNEMPITSWQHAGKNWIEKDLHDPPEWKRKKNNNQKGGHRGESRLDRFARTVEEELE